MRELALACSAHGLADLLVAKGIPCAFAEYLSERGGRWERVKQGIPGKRERIRSVPEATA